MPSPLYSAIAPTACHSSCYRLRGFVTLVAAALSLISATRTSAANPVVLSMPHGTSDQFYDAREFVISPDGSQVLVGQNQIVQGPQDSYVFRRDFARPIEGGAPFMLSQTAYRSFGSLDTGRSSFAYTPNGSYILHVRAPETGQNQLYVTPTAGGTSRRLMDLSVFDYQISPDSQRVLMLHDYLGANNYRLYSTTLPTDGPLTLVSNAANSATVHPDGFMFSPDGTRVLMHEHRNQPISPQIFSTPSNTVSLVNLDGITVPTNEVLADGLQFSPDSSRVLFFGDRSTDEVFEIFTVPSGGGTVTKLNGTLPTGGDVTSLNLQFSPNGARVLYQAEQNTDGVHEVYSVPSTGGASVRLNSTLVAGGAVAPISFSPDSSRVLYHGDQSTNNVFEVYSVSATGGANTKLNGPLVAEGDVYGARYSPDGARVVYIADQTTDQVLEIFSTPHNQAAPIRLNAPLAVGENVTDWKFTPDGSRVIYQTALVSNPEVKELYIVPTTGGLPVKLNAPLAAGSGVIDFQVSPTGGHVVYRSGNRAYENELPAQVPGNDHVVVYSQALNLRWDTSGGSWDDATNWDRSAVPDEVTEVAIDVSSVVTIDGGTTPRRANKLAIGGGTATAVLQLRGGAAVTTYNGFSILSGGVLRGDGLVDMGSSALTTETNSELRAGTGERLRIASTATLTNNGRIEAIGSGFDLAEIEIVPTTTNAQATGSIVARNGILRFNGGLSNHGSLAVSFGSADVFGDISNNGTGRIAVSGGAQATFHDDVTNNGIITVSAAGLTQSAAVFFGTLSGNGVGGSGQVFIEGDMRPGFSPGTMAFGGDVTFGPAAQLDIEIAGDVPGARHDEVTVEGLVRLNGTLAVTLLDGFAPTLPGQSFTIVTGSVLDGAFANVVGLPSPELPGLYWTVDYTRTSAILSTTALPGDIDLDGDVDRADAASFASQYGTGSGSIWTTGDFNGDAATTLADLALLQAHFGQSLALPASASLAAVPEPVGYVIVMTTIAAIAGFKRVRRSSR